MSTLGIGVPVWVGWTTAEHVYDKGIPGDPRCTRGVIVDGPFPGGGKNKPARSWWLVNVGGELWGVTERLLSPIDDGDEAVPRVEREPVEESA